jgi:hypothetical protein
MNTRSVQSMIGTRRRSFPTALLVMGLVSLLLQGCAHDSGVKPQAFASPEEAVKSLATAIRQDNVQQMQTILGSEGEQIISSGDDVADRQIRQKFIASYDEKHTLTKEGDDAATLVIGNTDWPFPIPIVKDGQTWSFDVESGKEEILNRRIGNNELSTIQVCKAIGDAQREYALRDPMGDGVHEYAQKFASDPDKRNGLFWRAADGEPPSPLGELAVQAAAEGYVRKDAGPTPYHGYCFRILRSQGPGAPGGALDYVVNGKMTLGFAVVAYPADYGNSGIMTFIMAADGVVYQKDLGENTATVASGMTAFDPGEGWKKLD